ncbi:hypothetical protein BGZ76_006434 [Entomortierella beljakovae]|nr:hypothetical protein BGZ76_006434 [Entomortierella beljakovae]
MLQGLFGARTNNLSIESILEQVNKYLEDAFNETNPAAAFKHGGRAKALLKDAERTHTKKTSSLVHRKGIADAYHRHKILLEKLGHHDRALKSHAKAEKWGNVQVSIHSIGSSYSFNNSKYSIRELLNPKSAVPCIPTEYVALHPDTPQHIVPQQNQQDLTRDRPLNIAVDTPAQSEEVSETACSVFGHNITPPITRYTLPETAKQITSTPQLAYCLSLLNPLLVSKEELTESEYSWTVAKFNDPDEKEQFLTMATDIIRAFVRDELKKPNVVAEVVSLAAVLDQDDYRKLLQAFIDGINQSLLLEIHLLDGLAQLIRNAGPGYIDADDFVKILELLNSCLKDTHQQSTGYIYRLTLTISQVLDSMVDSQVQDLCREQLHEPLSDYLRVLQSSSDPYLIYQASYAYQALQYIPDDETILQAMVRRTGKVVRGVSGVVSAVKAMDVVCFIDGLREIQGGLSGMGTALSLTKDAYNNSKVSADSRGGFIASLKEDLKNIRRSAWYPLLRGLDRLIQEGRFVEFEKLVREAPCRYNPAFQWGLGQRLGEIAASTIWPDSTRKSAVTFMRELSMDATWNQQPDVKQWILCIVNWLADLTNDTIASHVQILLQELGSDDSPEMRLLYQGYKIDQPGPFSTLSTLPPQESPLLSCVQNKPDIETPLRQLRNERLKSRDSDVYISPRAKVSLREKDHFDLASKVQEFIDSNRKVFLILGDSGAGKSTFNRALEFSLWDQYTRDTGRIPLFINLPAIKEPEQELIDKHLRKLNFTLSQIRELKQHREFILICDGYDEGQQTRNLYVCNEFNQPGGWNAQMVISCRSEYIGVDYRHCFEPSSRNSSENDLFQEAVMLPFDKDQIQAYVDQYVLVMKPSWKSEDHKLALRQIPNLQELIKNPFLLRLALEILPQLLRTNNQQMMAQIRRIQLYDEFISQWIERGKKRLTEMDLNAYDKVAFRKLSDSGFKQHSQMYLKELVTAIYDEQSGNPIVRYSRHRDRKTWKGPLFSDEEGRHLLRDAIPLVRNGDQYRFIHKSVLEYGLTLAVFDPSEIDNVITEATPESSHRESRWSYMSTDQYSTDGIVEIIEQPLLDSPLGKRNFVGRPSILQFLAERVQQQKVFKDRLLSIIEQSKTNDQASTAAANAITILVRAGIQFNGTDLRGIKVPGADLSYGVFDSAQLDGSNLENVNLRHAWLRNASLNGANMTGAQFGELPLLQQDELVQFCTYSADGKMFAVGLVNGDISLYETSKWERVKVLSGHSEGVKGLIFTATTSRLTTQNYDAVMALRQSDINDINDQALDDHGSEVFIAAFSPKGDQIASRGLKNAVNLWSIKTGKRDKTLRGHAQYVTCVAYSPKEGQLASGSHDRTVKLWNVKTGICIKTLHGHSLHVTSIAFSLNGDRLASGSWDKTIRLWDIESGNCVQTLQGHSHFVANIVYSPKGDQIASGSWDKTIRLWDAETGNCIRTLEGHGECVSSVAYSPKGGQIASGSHDKTVKLWDIKTGSCTQTLQGHSNFITSVIYSLEGDRIASGGLDSTVRLWDLGTSNWVPTSHSHNEFVTTITCSLRGDQIASGSRDKTVRTWDTKTGNWINTLEGHTDFLTSVAFSPKGDQIASGAWDNTVRLWDVKSGRCEHILEGHTNWVDSVMYSPKGGQVASGAWDKTVRLWDVDTGSCIHILQGHDMHIHSIAYSPKGDLIVSGSGDTTLRLWDVETGKCIRRMEGHANYVTSVAYSPKGDKIASGSWDKTVKLWDVKTGECVKTLQSHVNNITNIAYSPRGDQIASGCYDGLVHVTDIKSGQLVVTMTGFNGRIKSIAWEGISGEYLVTGCVDKSIRRWQIINEQDESKAVLCWSSSHEVLTMTGASFRNVQGLSRVDLMLISQRGALASPIAPTKRDNPQIPAKIPFAMLI